MSASLQRQSESFLKGFCSLYEGSLVRSLGSLKSLGRR